MSDIANLETLVSFSEQDFRKRFPETSFPETIETHHVAELGFAVVEPDPTPELAAGETVKPGALRAEGGRVFQAWEVIPAPDPDWHELIAARRYEAETAGIELSGIPVATDDRSKLLISGAAQRAAREPGYTLSWKTYEGFIDLSAEQVQAMADAVADHVQACFNREAELQGAVADGSITAEMLEQGWPS